MYAPMGIVQPPGAPPPPPPPGYTPPAMPLDEQQSGADRNRLRGCGLCMVVCCQIFLYVLAFPLFISAMVMFSIAAGNYDAVYFEFEYDSCSWSPWYNSYSADNGYHTGYTDDHWFCDDGLEEWEDWKAKKKQLKVIAIVTCLLFGASLLTAIILSVLTCAKNCGNKSRGLVHHEYLPAMSTLAQTTVATTTVPNRQVVNPMIQPVPAPLTPPSYSYAMNEPYRQTAHVQSTPMTQPSHEQRQMASPYEPFMTSQGEPTMTPSSQVPMMSQYQYSNMATK